MIDEEKTDDQTEALKAGALAIGNFHLKKIYDAKCMELINVSLAPTANLVFKILSGSDRQDAWTQNEIQEIWDRVESEINQKN